MVILARFSTRVTKMVHRFGQPVSFIDDDDFEEAINGEEMIQIRPKKEMDKRQIQLKLELPEDAPKVC